MKIALDSLWVGVYIDVTHNCFLNKRERISKGQSRETGNIGYTRRIRTNQKYNTKLVRHHYAQKTQIVYIRHDTSHKQLRKAETDKNTEQNAYKHICHAHTILNRQNTFNLL